MIHPFILTAQRTLCQTESLLPQVPCPEIYLRLNYGTVLRLSLQHLPHHGSVGSRDATREHLMLIPRLLLCL